MTYLPIDIPVLEKLTEVDYTKKKRVYRDEETGVMYYWFRNNGKGSKKGYYVDLDTVQDKEAFIEMSKNFEKEREELRKKQEEEQAHNKWVDDNHKGICKIIGKHFITECREKTKNWNDDQKREAEKYQSEYNQEWQKKYEEIQERKRSLPEPLREFADSEGYFSGFSITDYSSYGEGRGYCGYSQSTNAALAKKEGKFPKTAAAKILSVKPDAIYLNLDPCEYHHTSKHYNATDFYDIRPYYYLMHNEIDNLLEYLREIDGVDVDDEVERAKAISKYKKIYNKLVPQKRRIA